MLVMTIYQISICTTNVRLIPKRCEETLKSYQVQLQNEEKENLKTHLNKVKEKCNHVSNLKVKWYVLKLLSFIKESV